MFDDFLMHQIEGSRTKRKSRSSSQRGRGRFDDRGFKCSHCHVYVSSEPFLSGVNNRNHCPYCLWSRHLDLFEAGDRLSACKGMMRPVGLALKKTRKKYGLDQGELMIVHQCAECGKASINRIAADDLADRIFEVYEESFDLDLPTRYQLKDDGITLSGDESIDLVKARLFGWEKED
jgi:hypothetical protein